MSIAFGTYADFGMLVKKYTTKGKHGQQYLRKRYAGADRAIVSGSPKFEDIHTSYVERVNLNFRMDVKRLTRKTNAFSKSYKNCKRHIAIYILYHNYCRIHGSLKVTPAMEAGLTDHVWEVDELISLTNSFIERRLKGSVANDIEEEEREVPEGEPTHWVYQSKAHNKATVHEADCTHCRHGEGQRRGKSKTGEWLPFHSFEEAKMAAMQIEPDRYELCKTCIGSYRNAGGYRGPRS